MFDNLRIRGNLQTKSREYIRDNREMVCAQNQRMIMRMMVLYTSTILIYFILSLNVFASWKVTYIYLSALLIQIPVFSYILVRFLHKNRSVTEITITSAILQLYIMCFVCIISISPLNKSPAVYFAPIAIGFSVVFIYSWYLSVGLVVIECVMMIIASGFENTDIFSVNLFSTLLTMFLTVYLIRVLCDHRISENNTRKKLEALGMYDKLTGLYNKANTEAKCREFVNENPGSHSALFVIDFDNFKTVNDSFGHQQGDQVLMEFGHVLQEACQQKDIVGRIGGDEFLVFLTKVDGESSVEEVANCILENTRKILSDEMIFSFSCSIGICVKDEKRHYSFERMFSYADRALYQVKEHGKNNMEFFSEAMLDKESYKSILIVSKARVSRAVLLSCLEDDFHIYETDNDEDAIQIINNQHGNIASIIIDIDRATDDYDYFMEQISLDERVDRKSVV